MTDPKSPKTTSAQRQAALRQRARSLAYGFDDDDIRTAPDTALVEALAIAYRARQTAPIEGIAVELLHRLGRAVTVTKTEGSVTGTAQTEVEPEIPQHFAEVEPAQTEVAPVTVTDRGYPSEVRRMALGMADEGKSSREIADAIKAKLGRCPDVRNMAKLVRRWRS